ncbi:MAG: NnrS family protein [Burkholderiaceae bacterium]
MSQLLQIHEPARAAVRPQWRAFLELGFRPLYLAGCAWALIAIALWIFAPHWLGGHLTGIAWHAHEMLWGFIVTIAVGFLFTAGANWTGIVPLQGRALGFACVLWLVARLGFLVPGTPAFVVAAAAELGFLALAAWALARAVYPARSKRNYGLPLALLALGVADALFLSAVWRGDYVVLMQHFHGAMLAMALIALLVARRVIPFFATRAVPGLQIPMHTDSGQWQLGFAGLGLAAGWVGLNTLAAFGLGAAGALTLWQLRAWQPRAVRRVPLLWILYIGYGALGAGLLVAAAGRFDWGPRAGWAIHVIAVAGFSVLIIGMVTRTALGHLGRPLQTDRSMVSSYVLVIIAALLRLAALWPSPVALLCLRLSALAWIAAFALYLWRFFPIMIRPRPDQPRQEALRVPVVRPARAAQSGSHAPSR